VLITEKVRAHDGWLLNKNGERFMKNYYPKEMELAKRDEVSRSIFLEVKKGGGTDHGGVYLDIRHWGLEKTKELIPDVYDQYAVIGVDITKQKMEVYPTMHHMMGGIKINEWCHTPVEGFFACGEVAAGVHGANRLGGNSISEGQVFGRRAGISATKHAQKTTYEELPKQYVEEELEKINTFKSKKTGILPSEIESALKKTMWENVGVFRDQHRLELALMTINVLKKDMMSLKARNQAAERNRDLQDCIEVCNMVNTAEAVVKSALIRKESRGAHSRLDYPETKSEWEKNIQVIKNQNQISTEIIEVVKE
jgi:fumarate reductase (CoM/CoB) subunit A